MVKLECDDVNSKKPSGVGRNVFFTGLTSFLTDTTSKMIYSIMPLFLMSIGASKTELSLIEGIAEGTASVIKGLSGWWSDRIGRNKPLMVIGYAFTALLSPLFAFSNIPLHVLVIRFAERLGKGIRTAPRDSLVAASCDERTRGKSFGLHKAMDNSGAIVGPLMAFYLLSAFKGQYRRIFLLAGIPAVLGLVALILFVKEAGQARRDAGFKVSIKSLPKRYYLFLAILFVFTLGNSTDALLLVKASDVGIADTFIPVLYLIFNSVSVLLSVPAGMLSDRIGRERLIIFGYIVYSLIYLGFGLVRSAGSVAALFALYGMYSAATDGSQKAMVIDMVGKKVKGTGLGVYNLLIGLTLLPASLIAGALYDRVDNRAPFIFGSVMALIAAVLMVLFLKSGGAKGSDKEVEPQ